ncbi:alkaline phosphatase family protein [Lactiplantibacillus plantarum]|uniref:alkaline phosphatase family protein n=1 Tax=Lactiplantibacillus plantarum TaxID=1590 RepID=UPI0021A9B1AB|nr:alkaline phosphatase family protein [Lactiplantibacillus plantarum]MCT4439230.1 LPXTG cell wall anchor domain-containing protein [Lactiplantibacillus plantarum]MDP4435504.1 alkaline phosphatase family protein [Lactiplantibacillus plantarum]MDP4438527.1 alkaline phosphatase family protein [Lactiplantibacillus plantarum]MDP4457250.1 alkaline phosphatase family protein [Lactiplantibacillus plantarum]
MIKPRVLTTLLVCSAILTTTVTPAVAAVTPMATPSEQVAEPVASPAVPTATLSLAIQNQQLVDLIGQTQWQTYGQPAVTKDPEFNDQVLNLDGKSAFYTTFTDQQFAKLQNGMAIEAYFKYDPAADANGEHEIFSSQQGGGLGLGVQNNQVVFFAHDGSGYKTPKGTLHKGQWVHAVGVIDKNKTASLYLDGQLVQQVAMPGDLKLAQGTKDFVLGGDAVPGSHVQSMMTGQIRQARLYDQTLTSQQVSQLNVEAQVGKQPVAPVPVDQTIATKLVGPKRIASGHTYGLNVHARQIKATGAAPITMDVVYDAAKFDYVGAERLLQGGKTQIQLIAPGRIRLTTTANLSKAEFKMYAQTRLAHLNLKAKAAGETQIKFEQLTKDTTIELGPAQTVEIQGKYALDYNGDGIIGVGDVALANAADKVAAANAAEIKPYKHVVVLTTDGGGNPWDPKGMYYAQGAEQGTKTPVWTTNPEIMKKRRNTYTMDLFNKQFAMSTSARAVSPAISAQNYISMLHGRPWDTLPKGYQGTNATMGQEYFADFNKPQAMFPSVFKMLQADNPTRGAAAFSEWGPIVNSIIEPDAAVTTKQSASLKSFDDVANYIGTPEFQSTGLVYMQSDYMDGQGHGHGWYNDNYWDKYAQYDALFKRVMDKLEATGHIHDTLVIANADHGGSGKNHGGWDEYNRSIFMALGGETVDNGRRLHGGSNADISADISALILNALQVPQTPQMFDSQVFDSSAFLKQTDLSKKKRSVETLKLSRNDQEAKVQLTHNQNRQLTAFDLQLDLAGREVADVKVPTGVQILRQTVANGQLRLTVSASQPVTDLVTIKLVPSKTRAAKTIMLSQAMAATADGTEVLVDLDNDNPLTSTAKPDENGSTTTKPDGNGTAVKPDENGSTTTKPDGNGTAVKPDENGSTTTKPDGNGTAVKPDENGSATTKPDGNGTAVKPDENGSTTTKPDGNGTAVKPDENGSNTTKPGGNGTTVKPDKNGSSTTKPNGNGTAVKPDKHETSTTGSGTVNTSGADKTSTNDNGTSMTAGTASSHASTVTDRVTSGTVLPETSSSATTNHGSHSTGHHGSGWLPQTGEAVQRWLAVAGGVFLMLTGAIAVWWRKRRA